VKGKKMMKYLGTLIAMIALSGCQSLSPDPSPAQMAAGDFGKKPANIEQLLRRSFERNLYDPASVTQFVVSEPVKCGKKKGLGTPVFGWCSFYEYNAKNRLGGYVGLQGHTVMVLNERIIYQDGAFVNGFAFE